jgi:hypothetical protein
VDQAFAGVRGGNANVCMLHNEIGGSCVHPQVKDPEPNFQNGRAAAEHLQPNKQIEKSGIIKSNYFIIFASF